VKDRCAGKEAVSVALVKEKEADFVANALASVVELSAGASQGFGG